MTNVDFPDWSEARSLASEIAEVGAPLLRLTRSLGHSTAGLALPAATTTPLFAIAAIDQPGYEAQFELYMPANSGTVPFGQVIVTWTDSTSGIAVATDYFFLAAGNGAANRVPAYLSGPCKGDQVQISVANMDPAIGMTLTYTANVNSHIYTWDRLLQPAYAPAPPFGYSNPDGTPGLGVIAAVTPDLAPGVTQTWLIGSYNGKIMMLVDNAGQAFSVDVTIGDPAAIYTGIAQNIFFETVVASADISYTEITLPNGPVSLRAASLSANVNISPSITMIKQEY